jgi:cytochrome P450
MASDLLHQFRERHERNPYAANRMLFDWLGDDLQRRALYQALEAECPVLAFQSRAKAGAPDAKPAVFQQTAYLVASREMIEKVMRDPDRYGNDPYAELGSGTFMLGLDPHAPGGAHPQQRAYAIAALRAAAPFLKTLIGLAVQAASVQPLKLADFDLAEFAQQAALRFVGFLFGFPSGDHVLLERTLDKAYRGLNHQILGRHFVTAPAAALEATGAMGLLMGRVAELLDAYAGAQVPDEVRELGESAPTLRDFTPVLQAMAAADNSLSGNERAVVAVGVIAGIVGNIQAGVCTIVDDFFERGIVVKAAMAEPAQFDEYVAEALRAHPPAAFLPRRVKQDTSLGGVGLHAGDNLILAMGAATAERAGGENADALVYGGADDLHPHNCLGAFLAKPLMAAIVRQVVSLPGLSRTKDRLTGAPVRVQRQWGFKAESFPLRYDRASVQVQQPLQVIMQVKAPISEHAEALKLVIKYGAPQIEFKLQASRHVHFAWFAFLENDTRLALYTTYDGDLDAYIGHFAHEIGHLFDKLFEHIEDAPPLPVAKFPKEFVDKIRRYNQAPVGGYFFSAYPRLDASAIQRLDAEARAPNLAAVAAHSAPAGGRS